MTEVIGNVASYVLGDKLEAFLADYSSPMEWSGLLARYKPHGRHSLYGVARRHGAVRPRIKSPFDISPAERAAIMVDYVGAIPVADMAIKYGRSRQALHRRVLIFAPPEARQARKDAIAAARHRRD